MGFSSGLPLLLTLSTLSYWLAKVGVDKTSIGLFALVGLPYSLKFLWAPVIDQVRIPGLARLLGHRRSWALVTQAALILAILVLRSEEHTSELQSLMRISYAVFCLKKKTKKTHHTRCTSTRSKHKRHTNTS